MLATGDQALAERLATYRRKQTEFVRSHPDPRKD
jgi:hypothetical protein